VAAPLVSGGGALLSGVGPGGAAPFIWVGRAPAGGVWLPGGPGPAATLGCLHTAPD
jgi:hypothetical protein